MTPDKIWNNQERQAIRDEYDVDIDELVYLGANFWVTEIILKILVILQYIDSNGTFLPRYSYIFAIIGLFSFFTLALIFIIFVTIKVDMDFFYQIGSKVLSDNLCTSHSIKFNDK